MAVGAGLWFFGEVGVGGCVDVEMGLVEEGVDIIYIINYMSRGWIGGQGYAFAISSLYQLYTNSIPTLCV